jgi:UMF1 family MFS transporter
MKTANKKIINAWAMYDWANSVYNLVITSTIFPAFFESMTGDDNDATIDTVKFLGRTYVNTSLYNYALAVAFFIVAIMSPILSSIADCRGNKKTFMSFFMTMGSIACCGLYFFDSKAMLGVGIGCMIIACIGYWSSLVFYNSFLPEIAAPEDRDRVSAKGFAMGYIGSVILQVVCFVFVLSPKMFGTTTGGASRFSFLLVGLWWFFFAASSIRRLPNSQPAVANSSNRNIIHQGYSEIYKVWKQLMNMPVLKRFLFSFFFYNMGVQTIMLAATLYGKSELNIPTTNLIIAILIIQIIAIPGAYLMSKLSDKIGNIKSLMIAVLLWIFMCVAGYYVPKNGINQFYILAVLVGFIMGGIQSLSRSTYSKLMPETKDTTSFFSFFDVTEKVAIVIGMFSFGLINEFTGSQRNSVLALGVFFIIGLFGLFFTLKVSKKESLKSQ